MNRRGFLSSILRAAVADAVASSVRWLPMAKMAEIEAPERYRITVRTGLPTAYYRAINAGIWMNSRTTCHAS